MSEVFEIVSYPDVQGVGASRGLVMAIKLHYGGQTFSLPDGQAGFLSDYDGSPRVVDVPLTGGGSVRLFLGPGVPVSVEQSVPGKVRVLR